MVFDGQVGRGLLGADILLEWTDPSPRPIHAVSFSTFSVSGHWSVRADMCKKRLQIIRTNSVINNTVSRPKNITFL